MSQPTLDVTRIDWSILHASPPYIHAAYILERVKGLRLLTPSPSNLNHLNGYRLEDGHRDTTTDSQFSISLNSKSKHCNWIAFLPFSYEIWCTACRAGHRETFTAQSA